MGIRKKCRKCRKSKTLQDFEITEKKVRKRQVKRMRSWCMDCINSRNHKEKKLKEKQSTDYTLERRYTILASFCKKSHRFNLELSFEDYVELLAGAECAYCKIDLPRGRGYCLDRINSKKGYTKENCVPCCPLCNFTKSHRFTAREFYKIGQAIREIREERESKQTSEVDRLVQEAKT